MGSGLDDVAAGKRPVAGGVHDGIADAAIVDIETDGGAGRGAAGKDDIALVIVIDGVEPEGDSFRRLGGFGRLLRGFGLLAGGGRLLGLGDRHGLFRRLLRGLGRRLGRLFGFGRLLDGFGGGPGVGRRLCRLGDLGRLLRRGLSLLLAVARLQNLGGGARFAQRHHGLLAGLLRHRDRNGLFRQHRGCIARLLLDGDFMSALGQRVVGNHDPGPVGIGEALADDLIAELQGDFGPGLRPPGDDGLAVALDPDGIELGLCHGFHLRRLRRLHIRGLGRFLGRLGRFLTRLGLRFTCLGLCFTHDFRGFLALGRARGPVGHAQPGQGGEARQRGAGIDEKRVFHCRGSMFPPVNSELPANLQSLSNIRSA